MDGKQEEIYAEWDRVWSRKGNTVLTVADDTHSSRSRCLTLDTESEVADVDSSSGVECDREPSEEQEGMNRWVNAARYFLIETAKRKIIETWIIAMGKKWAIEVFYFEKRWHELQTECEERIFQVKTHRLDIEENCDDIPRVEELFWSWHKKQGEWFTANVTRNILENECRWLNCRRRFGRHFGTLRYKIS